MRDDRTITKAGRTVGFLGPVASCFTLAWLSTHRQRLHSLLLGGKRLTMLVVWDARGGQIVPHDDAEVDAIVRLTYGARSGEAATRHKNSEGAADPGRLPEHDQHAGLNDRLGAPVAPSEPGHHWTIQLPPPRTLEEYDEAGGVS